MMMNTRQIKQNILLDENFIVESKRETNVIKKF